MNKRGSHNEHGYRAKAARRPLLFWWQVFLFLAVATLLWYQIPPAAVFYTPRTLRPLSPAQAAYITLTPAEATQAFQSSFMNWTLGRSQKNGRTETDFGVTDLSDPLPPPKFLKQGSRYPDTWAPFPITPLPIPAPEILVPSAATQGTIPPLPEQPIGIHITPDQSLATLDFKVSLPDSCFGESTGNSRFYIETDDAGNPVHILLLSPRTPTRAALERMLMRGHASGATRGFIEIHWNLPK